MRTLKPLNLEFTPGESAGHGGFIDFHYNSSSEDFTSRIIESSSGTLTFPGAVSIENGLTVTKSGYQIPLTVTGGLSGNYEASIAYTHPEYDSTHNWVVGMGCGGLGIEYFTFWNNSYGNTFWICNNGSAKVDTALYVGNNVEIWTDAEGGNIRLTGNEGTKWSLDALDGTFRFIVNESSVPIKLYTDGNIKTYNGYVVCSNNFSLSGSTLYITTS